MAKTLRRQLTDEEKKRILSKHGMVCFATGHPIPEGELEFDHIRAVGMDGSSDLNNIAPMCRRHNRQKGTLPLDDFRVKLLIREFFKEGDKLTLGNLLRHYKAEDIIPGFGESVTVSKNANSAVIQSAHITSLEVALHKCPVTGWEYFYSTLGVGLIDSDDQTDGVDGLQPRYLIEDKVFRMYRHFQAYPVLQPSIGRLVNDRFIKLFDGQHKVAAQLFNGRKEFECKIYLAADSSRLNDTNIAAHDDFSQTRFYSSVMIAKLGSAFAKDFEKYRNSGDGGEKTESGFLAFLRQEDPAISTANLNKKFRSYLYSAVLEHSENKINGLVSAGNRGSQKKPITMDMLTKSFFKNFLYLKPLDYDMKTDRYIRVDEIENVVVLLNLFYREVIGNWNPENDNGEDQRRMGRILSSKSMMAWSDLVKDSVCGKLDIHEQTEREKPLYRQLSEDDKDKVGAIFRRLAEWNMWSAPSDSDIDRVIAGNKSSVKSWFMEKGLTTGYLMGASG